MATIRQIAKEAGVSIGTVDRVIHNRGSVNEETKKRILDAVKKFGYEPNKVAQGLAVRKKKLRLLFAIPPKEHNVFFADVEKGAKRQADYLKQYGVEVVFVNYRIFSDEAGCLENPETHEIMKGSDIKAFDGAVLLGYLPQGKKKRNNQALLYCEENQVPYVFYNLQAEGFHELSYVGCDYEQAGRIAAGLTALTGGDQARVWMFSEAFDLEGRLTKREEGFLQEVKNRYPKIRIMGHGTISGDRQKNRDEIQKMIACKEKINLVYIDNPADYSICRMIREADPEHAIRIITNDYVPEQMDELFEEGIISATICQEPEMQGEQSLNLLFRYLAYGEIPEKEYRCKLSVHIAQNR